MDFEAHSSPIEYIRGIDNIKLNIKYHTLCRRTLFKAKSQILMASFSVSLTSILGNAVIPENLVKFKMKQKVEKSEAWDINQI